MSNKAKRNKQQQVRNRNEAKQLNVIRGKVKNLDLTDNEALFYQAALKSKETPLEFLENGKKEVLALIGTFHMIDDLATDEETITLLKQANPKLHEDVLRGQTYLNELREELDSIHEANVENVAKLDNTDKLAVLAIVDVLEGYNDITVSLQNNAAQLVTIIKSITEMYFEAERICGEQNV